MLPKYEQCLKFPVLAINRLERMMAICNYVDDVFVPLG